MSDPWLARLAEAVALFERMSGKAERSAAVDYLRERFVNNEPSDAGGAHAVGFHHPPLVELDDD